MKCAQNFLTTQCVCIGVWAGRAVVDAAHKEEGHRGIRAAALIRSMQFTSLRGTLKPIAIVCALCVLPLQLYCCVVAGRTCKIHYLSFII